ncbi:MAG: heme lyase CcmF/NrfE family subunit [Bacillota bacterium]
MLLQTWNDFGLAVMLLGLAANVWAILALVLGLVRSDKRLIDSGRGAVLALAILMTLAISLLWVQFMTDDFSNEVVAGHSSTWLPALYKFSALWAGNSGSLLLWAWVQTILIAVLAYGRHREGQEMMPYAVAIMSGINLFFMLILALVKPPFVSLYPVPPEGNGLNPLLQDPGMVLHPTTLYIGYVGLAVPYAYAMTAMILNRADDAWIRVTRRWTLFAWIFLSIGIIFGGQWAYVVLGWGGWWAWDPVENASLLPWLTATAFLHSVMIQERRGMLKVWNVALVTTTFLLTLLGTYLTRSGILASVHAFNDTTLGFWFFGFMAVVLLISVTITTWRSHLLREENQFEGIVSKESSFLLNNLILVGMTFTVFWGTFFPLISEAVRGVKVTVGPPFYNQVMIPIGLALVLLMGVCPLLPWKKAATKQLIQNLVPPTGAALVGAVLLFAFGMRNLFAIVGFAVCILVVAAIVLDYARGIRARRKMTGENPLTAFWNLSNKNRRRYGGYVIHLAVIIMMVGIIGSSVYKQEKIFTVELGQTMSIGPYSVTYTGLRGRSQGPVDEVYTDLQVSVDGKPLGLLRAQKEFHPNSKEATTRVGILGGFKEDLYVILNGWESDQTANFKLLINPLMTYIWLGWYLMTIGTFFAMWPGRHVPAGATATTRQRSIEAAWAPAD